jgi:hypothetical protein
MARGSGGSSPLVPLLSRLPYWGRGEIPTQTSDGSQGEFALHTFSNTPAWVCLSEQVVREERVKNGVQEVAGSNPAVPIGIAGSCRASCIIHLSVSMQVARFQEHTFNTLRAAVLGLSANRVRPTGRRRGCRDSVARTQ